jgi:hypothetical protein
VAVVGQLKPALGVFNLAGLLLQIRFFQAFNASNPVWE